MDVLSIVKPRVSWTRWCACVPVLRLRPIYWHYHILPCTLILEWDR